jgi:hypothetical protein
MVVEFQRQRWLKITPEDGASALKHVGEVTM